MSTRTLASTERFHLKSVSTGRTYAISLAKPAPSLLTGAPPGDCPILFVLDSEIAFATAVETLTMRSQMGALRSATVVGVGYEDANWMMMRTLDMTPSRPEKPHPLAAMIGTEYGGADAFLAFLVEELSPVIRERVAQASAAKRILFGHSLGGLFAAHVLMTKPEAFGTFAISSPSLWWDDFSVLRARTDFANRLKARGARPRVLVEVAAQEQDDPKEAPPGMDLQAARELVRACRMVDAAREFAQSLAGYDLPDVRFVCFEGEDHTSVIPAAVSRSISFALAASE